MRTLTSGVLGVVLALAGVPVAQASLLTYEAFLDGPSENPPNASPGTGTATAVIDSVAHTMAVDVSFADLIGTTTAAHIHCCVDPPGNAGVASPVPTFPGFPVGVTSGTYNAIFDLSLLSSYNPAFVAGNGGTAASAEAALLSGLADGQAYLNIHTTLFPGGEIRGFFSATPEPASMALFAVGLAGAGAVARLRGNRRAPPK